MRKTEMRKTTMLHHKLPLLVTLLAAACGGQEIEGTANPDANGEVTYYRDIKPIFDAKCAYCHYEGGIAPFSLLSYEDAKSHGGVAMLAIEEGTMPPWQANDECNSYHGDRSLSQEQKDAVALWVEAGSPEGDPASEGDTLVSSMPTLSRVDQSLSMAEPYTPTKNPDDYRCFLIPWPEEYSETQYVTGFGAVPGNDKTVHHVIAYVATADQVATYQEMDAAEPGPGYTCYGGTGGPARSWLGAWAPGGQGEDLPEGLGLPIEPGSMIILQVHYNTTFNSDADQTGIELKIDASVDKEARVIPWANPLWLKNDNMEIPANAEDTMHSFALDPTTFAGGAFDIYNAALHMHNLGSSGKLRVDRSDGGDSCVLQIDEWDFDWQGAYTLQSPVRVNQGDKLYLECHWDNTMENQPFVDGQPQPPVNVYWGEGTRDEMCLGMILLAPAD